jgi:hypothetical protein
MSQLTKTEILEFMGYTTQPPPEPGIAARLKWEANEIQRQDALRSEDDYYERLVRAMLGSGSS